MANRALEQQLPKNEPFGQSGVPTPDFQGLHGEWVPISIRAPQHERFGRADLLSAPSSAASTGLTEYSQVDMLGLRYKCVHLQEPGLTRLVSPASSNSLIPN